MRIIVTTSNAYAHLMPEFAARFNRYWPNMEVTCLCYDKVPVLHSNFEVVSLGKQPEGKDWTSGLIPYFADLKDSHFVLMLDDYYLNRQVAGWTVRQIHNFSVSNNIDKFDLTTDRARFPHCGAWDVPFCVVSDQGARYRSSLQTAIWRRDYFRKFLVAGRTPWEFELLGEKEAMNDNAVIMGTLQGVVSYDNVMLKGAKYASCSRK